MFAPMHALNDPNAMKDYNFLPSAGAVAFEYTANDAIIERFSNPDMLYSDAEPGLTSKRTQSWLKK